MGGQKPLTLALSQRERGLTVLLLDSPSISQFVIELQHPRICSLSLRERVRVRGFRYTRLSCIRASWRSSMDG